MTTAAPPWAIPCWVDSNALYFELQGLAGPQVVAFKRGDLGKAIGILFHKFTDEAAGQVYLRPPQIAKNLIKDGITQRELDAAREVLVELGIIK